MTKSMRAWAAGGSLTFGWTAPMPVARVEASVAQLRLTTRGYGPDRPLIPKATTATEHGENRRVGLNLTNASGASDATR